MRSTLFDYDGPHSLKRDKRIEVERADEETFIEYTDDRQWRLLTILKRLKDQYIPVPRFKNKSASYEALLIRTIYNLMCPRCRSVKSYHEIMKTYMHFKKGIAININHEKKYFSKETHFPVYGVYFDQGNKLATKYSKLNRFLKFFKVPNRVSNFLHRRKDTVHSWFKLEKGIKNIIHRREIPCKSCFPRYLEKRLKEEKNDVDLKFLNDGWLGMIFGKCKCRCVPLNICSVLNPLLTDPWTQFWKTENVKKNILEVWRNEDDAFLVKFFGLCDCRHGLTCALYYPYIYFFQKKIRQMKRKEKEQRKICCGLIEKSHGYHLIDQNNIISSFGKVGTRREIDKYIIQIMNESLIYRFRKCGWLEDKFFNHEKYKIELGLEAIRNSKPVTTIRPEIPRVGLRRYSSIQNQQRLSIYRGLLSHDELFQVIKENTHFNPQKVPWRKDSIHIYYEYCISSKSKAEFNDTNIFSDHSLAGDKVGYSQLLPDKQSVPVKMLFGDKLKLKSNKIAYQRVYYNESKSTKERGSYNIETIPYINEFGVLSKFPLRSIEGISKQRSSSIRPQECFGSLLKFYLRMVKRAQMKDVLHLMVRCWQVHYKNNLTSLKFFQEPKLPGPNTKSTIMSSGFEENYSDFNIFARIKQFRSKYSKTFDDYLTKVYFLMLVINEFKIRTESYFDSYKDILENLGYIFLKKDDKLIEKRSIFETKKQRFFYFFHDKMDDRRRTKKEDKSWLRPLSNLDQRWNLETRNTSSGKVDSTVRFNTPSSSPLSLPTIFTKISGEDTDVMKDMSKCDKESKDNRNYYIEKLESNNDSNYLDFGMCSEEGLQAPSKWPNSLQQRLKDYRQNYMFISKQIGEIHKEDNLKSYTHADIYKKIDVSYNSLKFNSIIALVMLNILRYQRMMCVHRRMVAQRKTNEILVRKTLKFLTNTQLLYLEDVPKLPEGWYFPKKKIVGNIWYLNNKEAEAISMIYRAKYKYHYNPEICHIFNNEYIQGVHISPLKSKSVLDHMLECFYNIDRKRLIYYEKVFQIIVTRAREFSKRNNHYWSLIVTFLNNNKSFYKYFIKRTMGIWAPPYPPQGGNRKTVPPAHRKKRVNFLPLENFINSQYFDNFYRNSLPFHLIRETNFNFRYVKAIYDLSKYELVGKLHKVILKQNLDEKNEKNDGRVELESMKPSKDDILMKQSSIIYENKQHSPIMIKQTMEIKRNIYDNTQIMYPVHNEIIIDNEDISIDSEKVKYSQKISRRRPENIKIVKENYNEEENQNAQGLLELDSTHQFSNFALKPIIVGRNIFSPKKLDETERLSFILKTSWEVKKDIRDYQKLTAPWKKEIILKKEVKYPNKMIRKLTRQSKKTLNFDKAPLVAKDQELKDFSSYQKTRPTYKDYSVIYKPWWIIRNGIPHVIKKMRSGRFWIVEDVFQDTKQIEGGRDVGPKLVLIKPLQLRLHCNKKFKALTMKKPSLRTQRNIVKANRVANLYRIANFFDISNFFLSNVSYNIAINPPLEETWMPVNYIPVRKINYKHINCQELKFHTNDNLLHRMFQETRRSSFDEMEEYCLEMLEKYHLTDMLKEVTEFIENLRINDAEEESETKEIIGEKIENEIGFQDGFEMGSYSSERSSLHNSGAILQSSDDTLNIFNEDQLLPEFCQESTTAFYSNSTTSLDSVTTFMEREEHELSYTNYNTYFYSQKHVSNSESIIERRQRQEKLKEISECLPDFRYSSKKDLSLHPSETSFHGVSLTEKICEIDLPENLLVPIYNIKDHDYKQFKIWPIGWYLGWISLNEKWICRRTALAVMSPRCVSSLAGYDHVSQTYLITGLAFGDPQIPFHPGFKFYGLHNPSSYDKLAAIYLNQRKKNTCTVYGCNRQIMTKNRFKKRNYFSRRYFKIFKRFIEYISHPTICVSNNFIVKRASKESDEKILPTISLQYCKSDATVHKKFDLCFEFDENDEDAFYEDTQVCIDESLIYPGQSVIENIDDKSDSGWSVEDLFKKSSGKPSEESMNVYSEVTRPYLQFGKYHPIKGRLDHFIDVADRYDKLENNREEETDCHTFNNIKHIGNMENLLIPFLKKYAADCYDYYVHDCFQSFESGYNILVDRQHIPLNNINEHLLFEVPLWVTRNLIKPIQTIVNIHEKCPFKKRPVKRRVPFYYFSDYKNRLNEFLTWDQYIQMLLNPWKAVKLFFPSYHQSIPTPPFIDLRKIDLVYTEIPFITFSELYTIQETSHSYRESHRGKIKRGNIKKWRKRTPLISYGFDTPTIYQFHYLPEKESHSLLSHIYAFDQYYVHQLNYLHKRCYLNLDEFKIKNSDKADGTAEDKRTWRIFKEKLCMKEKESIYRTKKAIPMTVDCDIEEDSENEILKDAIKRRAIHRGDKQFLFKVDEDQERLNFIENYLYGPMFFFSYPRYYYAGFHSRNDISLPTQKMYLLSDFQYNEKFVQQVGSYLIKKEEAINYISPEKIRVLIRELYRAYCKNEIKDKIKTNRQYRNAYKMRKEMAKPLTDLSTKCDSSIGDEISTFLMADDYNMDIDFDKVDIFGREVDRLEDILGNEFDESQNDSSSDLIYRNLFGENGSLLDNWWVEDFKKEVSPSSSALSFILRRKDREIPTKNLKPIGLTKNEDFYYIELDDMDGDENMISLQSLIQRLRFKKFQKYDVNHFYIKGCVSFSFHIC